MGISNDLKCGLVFKNNMLLSINHCPWKFFHQFTGPLLLWMPAIMISQAGMMKTNIKCCLQLPWPLIKKNKSSWSHKNSVCNHPAYPASKPYDALEKCLYSKPGWKLRTWNLSFSKLAAHHRAGQRPARWLHPQRVGCCQQDGSGAWLWMCLLPRLARYGHHHDPI